MVPYTIAAPERSRTRSATRRDGRWPSWLNTRPASASAGRAHRPSRLYPRLCRHRSRRAAAWASSEGGEPGHGGGEVQQVVEVGLEPEPCRCPTKRDQEEQERAAGQPLPAACLRSTSVLELPALGRGLDQECRLGCRVRMAAPFPSPLSLVPGGRGPGVGELVPTGGGRRTATPSVDDRVTVGSTLGRTTSSAAPAGDAGRRATNGRV